MKVLLDVARRKRAEIIGIAMLCTIVGIVSKFDLAPVNPFAWGVIAGVIIVRVQNIFERKEST